MKLLTKETAVLRELISASEYIYEDWLSADDPNWVVRNDFGEAIDSAREVIGIKREQQSTEKLKVSATVTFECEWDPRDYEKPPTRKQILVEVKKDLREYMGFSAFIIRKLKIVVEEK